MINYILYAVFLLIGIGAAYFYFKSKIAHWGERLSLQLDNSKKGNASVNSGDLPKELKEVSDKLNLLFNQNKPVEAPQKTPEKVEVNSGEIKKKLDNALIINELGEKITSSLLLKDTFDHLYSTLNSMMDAAVIELSIYDIEKESWKIYSNLEIKPLSGYRNHIAEWVRTNERMVFLEDAENDFGRYVNEPLKMPNDKLAQSIISFPIQFHNAIAGVITVVSFRKNAFDNYHKASIEHLLGFLSVALQNAFTHEQLNLLKIRAEESEKHEQQFLANMSHEIRTPMNAVLGMTNLLLDTKLDDKQNKYLKAINISSKNLLVIINDILDLSKLEAGKMEIEKIPFRIRDVLQNVKDTNKFKGEEKGLLFEVNISPDLPEVVKGDPTRLNQILTNLCSNAIKFTEKGKITISADIPEKSHFIRFRVIDTGIGIPEDKLHLLFTNFKQVDSSTFRKYGGTGLGLSISKTLIELQGGKVEVKSKIGVGSEFSVQIPYEVGTEAEVSDLHMGSNIDYSGLSGIRILVAEDNEYNQIVINDTLETLINDLHLDIAVNGLVALQMLEQKEYDLILMDAQMPEMDGFDATRAIRKLADEKVRNIPIIALTASVHKADIDKCLNCGMDGFIPKPFTRDELLGTIAQFYNNLNAVNVSKKVNKSEVKKIENLPTNSVANEIKERVTNMDFLLEFTEGDKQRMKKYIGLYLKLLPDNLSKIEAALNSSNFPELVKVMHAMRPHLKYMGMENASTLAAEIENNVQESKNLDKINEMSQLVLKDCNLSKDELEIELSVE